MKNKHIFLTLFITLCSSIVLYGQDSWDGQKSNTQKALEEVVIEKGEISVLEQNPPRVKRLIIQGTLRIADGKDITLYAEQVEIDGGVLQVGNTSLEHKSRFSLLLTGKTGLAASKITVKNQGRLLLNGSSGNIPMHTNKTGWKIADTVQLQRNIVIGTETSENFGFLIIENTGDINISGVAFNGLGTKEGSPAVSWYGSTQKRPGYINNSLFVNSKNTDLYLDKTSAAIENNFFISEKGASIICSPSGIGMENDIEANRIFNSNDKGLYAIIVKNPYQSITNNLLSVKGNTNGIGVLLQEDYKNFKWTKLHSSFVLEGNTVERKITNVSQENIETKTIGIFIDNFDHTGIWRTKQNKVSHFDTGVINKSKNITLDKYILENNTIGLVPGPAYINNSSIILTPYHGRQQSKAVWVTDTFSKSKPKITNLSIKNYPIGIAFEGKIGADNYFKKITYDAVEHPVQFSDLEENSYVFDKDNTLVGESITASKSVMTHHHGHSKMSKDMDMDMGDMDHGTDHTPKGSYLVSSDSFWKINGSVPLKENAGISKIPASQFGELTISTGFGLDDPVHEHWESFNFLSLVNTQTQKRIRLEGAKNRETFMASGNAAYELAYELPENVYDISLEWDAPKDSWIVINVPYKHDKVYALRSFGKLIAASPSKEALLKTNETSYFIDASKGMVTVKLYNTTNHNELVLYSSEVLVEIAFEGKKVPLTMKTDVQKNEVIISYHIPDLSLNSNLVLTDGYGNPIEILFNGISESNTVTATIDMNKYDLGNTIFLYFLTIDGQKHKGPVYAY